MSGKLWGRVTTIGSGGCYVEMPSPFQPGTRLELLVGVYGVEARLSGEVRWWNPRLGMGIMFIGLEERQVQEIERLIAAAAGRLSAQS